MEYNELNQSLSYILLSENKRINTVIRQLQFILFSKFIISISSYLPNRDPNFLSVLHYNHLRNYKENCSPSYLRSEISKEPSYLRLQRYEALRVFVFHHNLDIDTLWLELNRLRCLDIYELIFLSINRCLDLTKF